jgi:2-oxo-4-hydroxy-4-carboxy--5-ureidoimidazoline (OHCU) decarboxylase
LGWPSGFWLPDAWQIAAYVAGVVMISTAAIRFCPLYKLFGIRTAGGSVPSPRASLLVLSAFVLLGTVLGGSYASIFFSRKLFLEDFNAMNNYYKQTLFLTGKDQREQALENYTKLMPTYQQFQRKYTHYQPYVLRGDAQFSLDLSQVATMLSNVNTLVREGDLHQAHLVLEKVRPVFQEIFKRNGFSLLAVAMVDFHDAMELMLDAANQRDASKLIDLYPQVSEKLKVIEAEANDAEIQDIRSNLDALLAMAHEMLKDTMPAKGDQLKSSFIKVYLKRG